MQLRRLRLSGIGPFAREHSIDFDALGHSGLFLLEGPTGSGKSMLIDAIVFALYGKPASDNVSDERLRSHHAGPRDPSWVELVFETDAGIFRVHRTPAHHRAKARGTGTTKQNATAHLVRVTSPDDLDSGEVLSTAAQEVGGEITTLIGLTRAQFAQTVVLPQGEFAAFLRAKAEDRRKVLESIFRTGIYEHITDQLIDDRKRAYQEQRRATEQISRAGQLLASAASRDGEQPDGLQDVDDLNALMARAQEVMRACSDDEARLREQRDSTRRQLDAAQTDYDQRRKLAELLEQRRGLVARKTATQDAQPHIDELRETVRFARQAATVRTALNAQQRATDALTGAEAELQTARSMFGEGADTMTVEQLGARIVELSEYGGKLQDLHQVEAGLHSRADELAELDEQIQRADQRRSDLMATIEDRPNRRAQLNMAVVDAQEATNALPAAEHRAQQNARTLEAVRRRDELVVIQADHGQEVAALAERAQAAIDDVAELRRLRIDGMAGELATGLRDGQPCAVCGSTRHPAPAKRSEHHPDQEAIDAAEATQHGAERHVADARERYERVRAELSALHDQYEELSTADADARAVESNTQLTGLRERAARLGPATAALADFDAAAKDIDAEHARLREHLVTLRADYATLHEQLARDRSAVGDALTGAADGAGIEPENLTELIDSVARRRTLCEELREALRRVDECSLHVRHCDSDVADALSSSEFSSGDEARSAALSDEEIEQLDVRIRNHDTELAAVASGLDDPALAVLTGDEDPALDEAGTTLSTARTETQSAQERLSEAEYIVTRATDAHKQLTDAVSVHAQTIADTGPVIRLAGVAEASNASNLKKVTLSSYVLLRRFEDVVTAANSRLVAMSVGRFSLVRSEETETRGGRRTGLGLRVLDHFTGSEREPRTLSGGQTFYTSLSLALGLADVVTGESGGLTLGTLFVDEGFGTLDAETLDTVMAALGALSTGGRLVGVVSHVDELKQRISDRISVRPTSNGPSQLLVRGTHPGVV